MKHYRKGFTLIELLVVIAIIAILAGGAVLALANARQKANDSRRLSDMTQVQTAMELLFNDTSSYALTDASGQTCGAADLLTKCALPTVSGGNTGTLNFATLVDPSGSTSPCPTLVNGSCTYAAITDPTAWTTDYSICFNLEKGNTQYAAGLHELTNQGIATTLGCT